MRKSVWISVILSVFAFCGSAFALTAGDNYTVSFSVVQSNGTVGAASYSTTATADSTGLITFSLSGVPDNTSCNFMVVKATNMSVNPNTVDLESVVPCPNKGTTMPLGLSSVTNAQATALEAAFKAAGTDDPILAVFLFTAVQTTDISLGDLGKIAQYAEQGIVGMGGYVDYLKTTRTVTDAELAQYRKNIVADLANPDTGYTKFIKDSVDATDPAVQAQDRGKAAAIILSTLVQATNSPTDAGIHAGWIIEATDQMGNIVVPQLNVLSAQDAMEIQSSIGTGLQKLREQVAIQKYSNAMSLLGGTGADIQQFNTAATALSNASDAAMEKFNQKAFANGLAASTSIMNAAQADMDTTMQNAFQTFQGAIAASDQRIGITNSGDYDGTSDPNNMIKNICTALGANAPSFDPTTQLNALCTTVLAHMDNQWGMFKWYGPNGTQVNWPVNMVILADWTSNLLKNGGSMSYTRDTTDFTTLSTSYPNDQMFQWSGYCAPVISNATTCQNTHGNWMSGACYYYNKQDCTTNGGAWNPSLSCFGQHGYNGEPLAGEAPSSYCQQNPYPYWIMFAIQQDIQVVQDIRQQVQQAAGQDMSKQGSAEQNFNNALSGIANNVTGTTAGSTAITKDQQKAIMELMSPPQM